MLDLNPIKFRIDSENRIPWETYDAPMGNLRYIVDSDQNVVCQLCCSHIETAELIANAPNDIATLVVEVEALRSALAELLDAVRSGSSEDINTTMVACEELLDAES